MIKFNRAKCLACGDTVESFHRHDYQTCSCGNIAVDGGRDYLKRSVRDMDKYTELTVNLTVSWVKMMSAQGTRMMKKMSH